METKTTLETITLNLLFCQVYVFVVDRIHNTEAGYHNIENSKPITCKLHQNYEVSEPYFSLENGWADGVPCLINNRGIESLIQRL